MAGKIRGVTIELDGDTSGLTKSLSSVNKEIKDTQTQLKDVERLLKLDPSNTELLRQKQELLGKAISETNDKLKTLKEAEATMKSQGVDENSAQFMALQREIISTEENLKKLTKEADNTKSAFEKVGEAANKVAEGADKVAKKTKALSAAGAVVVGAIGALGVSSIKSADDLATLSKRTGVSTDMLQKFAYASDMVDVSTEELAGAIAKMKKNIANSPDKFEELGIAVKNADGTFRDIEDIFYDTLAVLGEIEGETERDIASMDLFGKSADTLATIIDDGGEGLRMYGEKAAEMGLILDEQTIAKLTETGDAVDEMKARTSATFAQLGADLIEKLGPTLENIINKIGELVDWIGTLDGDTLVTIGTVALIIASISPIASIVSGISTAINGVSTALDWLLANPIVLLIAAIVALVALIATSGDEIQAALQKVDDFLQGVFATDWTETFGAIGEVINLFFAIFGGVWDGVKQILDGIINFIRGVFTGDWNRAWEGIKQIFSGVFTAIQSIFERVSQFFKNMVSKDWTQTFGVFGNLFNAFFKTVSGVWDSIKTIFNGILTFVKGVFTGDWTKAWEGIKTIFKGVFDGLVAIAKGPINLIIGILNGLIDGLNWIVDGINKISFEVPDWVPLIGGKRMGFNLGKIGKLAYLADGGVLTAGSAIVGEMGPELLTMQGDRAVVQPLTNNTQNYGGVNINVYSSPGQDISELAEIIMDEIGNATRRQEAVFA